MKLLPNMLALVMLAVTLGVCATATPTDAQSSTIPDWQTAAGGKMVFDVASVKANKSSDPSKSNFPLGPGTVYPPNGGFFAVTNFRLSTYISFAYKMTNYQTGYLFTQLPKWAIVDRFDILARAPANTTKDQMRLMMQSLLADRFKLVVHTETRQVPVFALVLVKPGKTGPQLRSHPADSPCSTKPPAEQSGGTGSGLAPTGPDGFPIVCGGLSEVQATVSGRFRWGARDVPLRQFANQLTGMSDELDRPVLDETGLTGNFDFVIEWILKMPAGANVQTDDSGPTLMEALRDQLGLKLESTKRPVDTVVVEHIEEPSEN
jgi:uncharacterized protein (TIGR03435 family)